MERNEHVRNGCWVSDHGAVMRSSEIDSAPSLAGVLLPMVLVACFYVGRVLAGEGDIFSGPQGRLKVQSTLLIDSVRNSRTLKTIDPGQVFQGYGYLSPSKVFVASTSSRFGDASTDLEVIDLDSGLPTLLYTLGATGESEFVVSPDGAWVAFNWTKGIWVFSARDILADLSNATYSAAGFEGRLRLIAESDPCWSLRWVDPGRLSYCTSAVGYGCSEKQAVVPGEKATSDRPQAPRRADPEGPSP